MNKRTLALVNISQVFFTIFSNWFDPGDVIRQKADTMNFTRISISARELRILKVINTWFLLVIGS